MIIQDIFQEIIYDNLRHKLIQKGLESILVSQYVRKTKDNLKKKKPQNVLQTVVPKIAKISCVS